MLSNKTIRLGTLLLAVLALGMGGPLQANERVVRLATTTSTENSGLLGYLLPVFERQSGYKVHSIAVGTGKALRMGRNGDADLVLVHARSAEDEFVAEGYGVDRRDVMYNDFVIVGPTDDPAGISGLTKARDAFEGIAKTESPFVSRGDDSGTHKKELGVWQSVNIQPDGSWYREAGQGMGKVLQIAGEMDAYTLTDRGTWLNYRGKTPLRLLFEGDPQIYNPYGIIATNPERHPHANHAGAIALMDWITSPEGQTMIQNYQIAGQQAFFPMAVDVRTGG